MTTRWRVALVGVVLLAPLAFAQAVPRFQGRLNPSAPIEVNGDITIDSEVFHAQWIAGDPADVPVGRLFEAPLAWMNVTEWYDTRPSLPSTDSGVGSESGPPGGHDDDMELKDPHTTYYRGVITLDILPPQEHLGAPNWVLSSSRDPGHALAVPGAQCDVTPAMYLTPAFPKMAPPSIASRETPWLDAVCDVQDVNVTGWFHGLVYNTSFRATALQTTKAGEPLESEPKTRIIKTGIEKTKNETVPFMEDYTERIIEISTDGFSVGIFHPDAPLSGVEIRSPALGAVGQLSFPQSTGNVQWGDWEDQDDIEPFAATGVFWMGANRDGGLEVTGAAAGAPGSATLAPAIPFLSVPATLAVAAVAGAAGAALLWPRSRWFLLTLFTRLTRDSALDQTHRRSIMDLVEARPGLKELEVVHGTGLNRGTVRYHVRVLSLQRLISRRRIGGQTGLFPPGRVPDEATVQLQRKLADPTVQAVLAALREDSRRSQDDVARRVSRDRSSVARILKRLVDLGAVQVVVEGRSRRYVVAVPPPADPLAPAPAASPETSAA